MAVENDYNLLVFNLNELANAINSLRHDVQHLRLKEAREGLAPNETHWVNRLALQLSIPAALASQLHAGAQQVLGSRPGEAVFEDQPPPAPDAPPQ